MTKRRGTVTVDQERCKGCSYCVVVCPVRILRLSETTNRHSHRYAEVDGAAKDRCTACGACGLVCPEIAIEVWKE